MALAGTPWQLECEKVEQRFEYLLKTGIWSDCIFMVGTETNQEVIQAHKLVLAMASPVFEAMFYGGLSERNDPIIPIPDVQPEAFRALLQYIYTGNINICSFNMAWDLWYGAKKYMLPHLVSECNSYICSVLSPSNACRAYEFAHLFDDKTLIDKCIKVISTKSKEVLNDSSFMNLELNTVITVCSLDHLTVDSELDLFHAVARYAEEEEQRRQGQITPPVDGSRPSEEMPDKVLQSVASSSQTSPAAELHSKTPTGVVTSEPTADKENLKAETPTIRAALQKIRFLSLSAQEFAEGPARSDLLTQDEAFKILMNITSRDSTVPMPTGFTACREPRNDSKKKCFEAGSLDHTMNSFKCGDPSQVLAAARAAVNILSRPRDIQQALDEGILDALVPALTDNNFARRREEIAVRAIYNLCEHGSPAQLRVLAESAALEPYCRLITAEDDTSFYVLHGLRNLLQTVEQNTRLALLLKLREIGVPRLLLRVRQDYNCSDRGVADNLLRTYFSGGQ